VSFQTSALIVTWAALLVLALVVSGLVRQVHALNAAAATEAVAGRRAGLGPRPGAPAPGIERLGLRPPGVLLFLNHDCHTCTAVLHEADRLDPALAVHALYAGPLPGAPTAGNGGPRTTPSSRVVRHGEQAELFGSYDAIATPFAVVVDAAGRVVRSAPVGSAAALHAVLGGGP
jgi:hypothetical protein